MAASSRTGTWTAAVALLGGAMLAVSAVPPASSAAAARQPSAAAVLSAPLIDPSAVVTLSDPGVELTAPVDGRLRGDGIALVVNGAALTDRAGQGDETVSAGAGNHLIVFGLRQIPQPDQPDGLPVILALVQAGQRRKVDLSVLKGTNPGFYAASVPDRTTDVMLELTVNAFSQRFNLMTLSRPGTDPAILYRDPDHPQVVSQLTGAVNVAATVPANGDSHQITIGVPTVSLQWFSPVAGATPAPAPDRAFLVVTATEKPVEATRDGWAYYLVRFDEPFPANRVHVRLPDGSQVDGTKVDAPVPSGAFHQVDGVYYFPVPADLSTATLVVDAYQLDAEEVWGVKPVRVSVAAVSLPIALSVAPAPPPTPPVTSLTLNRPNRPASATTATAKPRPGDNRAPLWIVLILLTGAAAVTWAGPRRRRRPTKPLTTVTADPPTAGPSPSTARVPMTVPARPAAPDPSPAAARPAPSRPAAPPPTERPSPPVPTEAVADESPAIRVGLLGPRQITGVGTAKLRPRDLEVFVFLAVNADRTVANDDIRAALAGAVDDESNANTVRTWLSRIRTTVGPHVLPEADSGRYRLAGVDTDIAQFQRLTTRAAAAGDSVEATRLLKDALGLVRGRPFEGLDYRWTHLIIANLDTRIANAANRLAELSGELHDPGTAAWAAQRGLAAAVQPDDRLLSHLLLAASAFGPAEVTQAWREVTARYAAVGDAPRSDLVALYDRLRTRQHTS